MKNIKQVEKIELHVHLEGSIQPDILFRLAERHQINLPAKDSKSLRNYFRFKNFSHFIEVYNLICSCLRDRKDFELITYEFGSNMVKKKIQYAEVTLTPYLHVSNGIPFDQLIEGITCGRKRAYEDYGVQISWIFDIPRHKPESAKSTLEFALAAKADAGVVALGLGGDEANYPPELFVHVFEKAKDSGLHSVPHAGETAGPESIWVAVMELGADRIGHGVRCIEDPKLLDYLGKKQIPLEICLTSNICLGVFPTLKHHPIRKLFDLGLNITVNSDDPALFNTDLNNEYQILMDKFQFSTSEIEKVCLNALDVSFLPRENRENFRNRVLESFKIKGDSEPT